MNKYKVLNPISFGGRKEAGEIIELTDFQAAAYDNQDIALLDQEEVEETPVEETETTPVTEEDKTLETTESTDETISGDENQPDAE